MSTREDREIDAREDRIWDALAERDEELTCERCGGDREVQANYGLVNWDEPRWVECPECNGTGRINPDDYDDPYWEPRA